MAALKLRPNLLIGLALVLANLFFWGRILTGLVQPHIVDPVMHPEVKKLLEYIASGEHSGESWEITMTELQAEQTITWYLKKYPQIPFAYPEVHITPDYVGGEGDVLISGLRLHVSGRARVTLENGLPVVEILSLNLPLPPAMREAIQREIAIQLRRAELLPVRFNSAEWGDGVVVVKGIIR